MATPTDDQLAALASALDAFARRYKLAEALGPDKPLNELDKQALMYVADHPDCGPTDVARFLAVPNTTISSATDRLVKRGFLGRRRLEANRRAVALRLTSQGKARVEGYRAEYRAFYRRLLQPLSPSERDNLIRLMTKIVSYED